MTERAGLTRNSILRITDEKTLQLIQEWEKEECLWNSNLEDYPNIQQRAVATETIAKRLAIPNFKPEHVTMKFKNLRNSYSQELKRMAADKNYKPKVFWFSYMDKFLRPHLQKVKKLRISHDKSTTEVKTEVISDDDDQDWSIANTTQSEASDSNSTRIESTFPEFRNSELYKVIQSDENRGNSLQSEGRKRKLSDESTSTSQNGDLLAKSIANNVGVQKNKMLLRQQLSPTTLPHQSEHRKADYLDNFGAYIASLLRTLPPKKALMLQPAILELIVSVGAETLDDESNS